MAESKQEEFMKYLEKSGVIDAMTKVLVGLYEVPDRPANAIDFIKEYLGAPLGVDVEQLRSEIEQLKEELKTKNSEIENRNKEVESLTKKINDLKISESADS